MHRRVLVIMAMVFLARAAEADLYQPDRPLFMLKTGYFVIVFPVESRNAAEFLSTVADGLYEAIAALLETTPKKGLTIVITPDPGMVGGYYTAWPYPRIVLYQAATDLNSELGSFRDDLVAVFRHEVTHAVSLSIRGPVQDALVAVFGSPFGLSNYTTPLFFAEGVTVSLESQDGFGRADDPLAGAQPRQDIIEGKFKTPWQAAGAWDRYPAGLYYAYGGYFSRWLQERFGMERYATLWRRLGGGMLLEPLERGLLSRGHFFDVYGMDLDAAWEEFRSSMAIRVPVYMDAWPIRPLSRMGALASAPGWLYYSDTASQTVYRRGAGDAGEEALFRAGLPVSRLDAAPDGSLLVSTYRLRDGLPRLALMKWDAGRKRLDDLRIDGLRDAAWTPGGDIVAVRVDGFRTDIVLHGSGGERRLLAGSERVSYAVPCVSDDGSTLYALARIDGVVSIIRASLAGKDAVPVQRLALPPGIAHLRGLSLSGGTLLCAWDDGSLYRLVEIEGNSIRYQAVPASGGVHRPVSMDGTVYYIGSFSGGSAPCAFPADREPLGFREAPAEWEDAAGLLPGASSDERTEAIPAIPYSSLPWLLPRFWLPTFSIDSSGLADAGAAFYMADPVERLATTVWLGWDVRASAADASVELAWTRWSPTVFLRVADGFDPFDDSDPAGAQVRSSQASAGLSDSRRMLRGGTLGWSVGAGISAAAKTDASDPYAPWSAAAVSTTAGIDWYDLRVPTDPARTRYGYGFSLAGRADRVFFPAPGLTAAGITASGTAALPWLGIAGRVDAAMALSGSAGYDGQGYRTDILLDRTVYPAYGEFSIAPEGRAYVQGELATAPLSAEIQRRLGPLYANRLSLVAGARACAVDIPGSSLPYAEASAFGRLELTWTPLEGAFATIHPTFGAELWYRMGDGLVGFSFSFDLDSLN